MFRITRLMVVFVGAAIFVALTGSLVFAIFPKLQTTLSGPAINGQVPQGKATVDQSGLPSFPAQLKVRVQGVNLPAGTSLHVILGRMFVGTITLAFGEGSLHTALQFQVGRLDPIFVVTDGGNVILSGGAPWKVSSEFLEEQEPAEKD